MRHIQKSQFLIYRLHNKISIVKIQYSKTLFTIVSMEEENSSESQFHAQLQQ